MACLHFKLVTPSKFSGANKKKISFGALIGTHYLALSKRKVSLSIKLVMAINFSILGEHLTEGELVEYLMTLLGHSDNPEVDKSFTQDIITALEEIPEKISPPTFAEDIVGLSI